MLISSLNGTRLLTPKLMKSQLEKINPRMKTFLSSPLDKRQTYVNGYGESEIKALISFLYLIGWE